MYNQSQQSGFKSADTKVTQASSPMSHNKASTFEGVSSCVRGRDSGPGPMVELAIDSSDAFDYENPDNAKYSVNDLKFILHKEVLEIQSKSYLSDLKKHKKNASKSIQLTT